MSWKRKLEVEELQSYGWIFDPLMLGYYKPAYKVDSGVFKEEIKLFIPPFGFTCFMLNNGLEIFSDGSFSWKKLSNV